jgi:anti-sigma regulatory factor (Ser/Thr protein kinase)
MGFWEEVYQLLDAKPEQIPVRPARLIDRSVLLDITIMRSHDAISVMLRKTGEILQNLGFSITARGHVLEVLSELCSNVLLHAQTEYGGVAAMQTYRNRSGERYLVMSIADAGIGVRRSLAANMALAERLSSDAQALGVAVQPGASRFASGGHGGGLPRVLEIARRYEGKVAFRSGMGALAFNGSTAERRSFDASPLSGTQLRITLPESKMRTDTQGDLLVPEEE